MIFIGELQQGAIGADGDDPQGIALPLAARAVGGVLQPAAAGNLHAQQGDALMELAARMAVSLSA